jgi:hypothetical protein
MLSLKTNKVVTRGRFVILPMPDIIIEKITKLARRQGYSRSEDPTLEIPAAIEEDAADGLLPDMMNNDGRSVELETKVREHAVAADNLGLSAGGSNPAKT